VWNLRTYVGLLEKVSFSKTTAQFEITFLISAYGENCEVGHLCLFTFQCGHVPILDLDVQKIISALLHFVC
jgi:hypothetical protein